MIPPVPNATAVAQYARDGFFVAPQLVPDELLSRVAKRMTAVYHGDYETGVEPLRSAPPVATPPTRLVKIDNAHRTDTTIYELITQPVIGAWAAALTGARLVQVFATQLLIKPPSSGSDGNVGWHQDLQYWTTSLSGDLFTAWIAVSEVPLASGAMRFVRGSQLWGLVDGGDFFNSELDRLQGRIREDESAATWQEVPAVMPAGAVSFHQSLTVHGSGPNETAAARLSFAVHLRTETGAVRPDIEPPRWLNSWDDQQASPVIYRRED